MLMLEHLDKLAAASAQAGNGYPPTPIGVGPRFHLLPATPAVRAGRPVGALRCVAASRRFGAHIELFAHNRVVIVPAGIGVATPFTRAGAYVRPGGCTYPLRTLQPTGVVQTALVVAGMLAVVIVMLCHPLGGTGRQRLRLWLATDPMLSEHHITGSFGVASFPVHGFSAEDIIRVADAGMYVSKKAGGDRVSAAEEYGQDQSAALQRQLVSGYVEGFLQRARTGPEPARAASRQIAIHGRISPSDRAPGRRRAGR